MKFGYPFRNSQEIGLCKLPKNCEDQSTRVPNFPAELSYGTSSEFFVTTGVISFIYATFALVFYIFGFLLYEENPILPFFDLLATIVLSLFWLLGFIAWVAQSSNMKEYILGIPESLCESVGSNAKCEFGDEPHFSRITISLISGFASFILWSGSVWFVLKETHFLKVDDSELNVTPRPPLRNF